MADRREQILARIRAIIGGIDGIRAAGRNREDVQGRNRPAFIMHDAVEESADLQNRPGRPARVRKDLMRLQPQLFILLGDRAEQVGTSVSVFRRLAILAIWNDDELWSLVGQNGEIRYMGSGLDTTAGESREARLELHFEFTYLLDINELAAGG